MRGEGRMKDGDSEVARLPRKRAGRLRRHLEMLPPDHRARRLGMLVGRNLNYWLFQHFYRNQAHIEQIEGLELLVLPGVFNPGWFHTTPVLVRLLSELPIAPGARVLELCTGTGAAAIAVGKRGLGVVAVELNPMAVHCARLNVRRNGVSGQVEVREGDLYGPVRGERFDLIVCNPPFLDGEARDLLELAFLGGPAGEVMERLLLEAPVHLTAHGRMVISYSSLAPRGRIEGLAARAGLRVHTYLRTELWSEVIEHYVLEREEER